jgi:hypothetical protein
MTHPATQLRDSAPTILEKIQALPLRNGNATFIAHCREALPGFATHG